MIAKRIKELRTEKGISLAKIAKEIGYSDVVISYWENGKRTPTANAIVALALFFDVSADYLLGLENEDGTRNTKIVTNSFNNVSNSNIKF